MNFAGVFIRPIYVRADHTFQTRHRLSSIFQGRARGSDSSPLLRLLCIIAAKEKTWLRYRDFTPHTIDDKLAALQNEWIDTALANQRTEREPRWSEALAVGRSPFVEQVQSELGSRKRYPAASSPRRRISRRSRRDPFGD